MTRSSNREPIIALTNEQLAEVERTGRRANRERRNQPANMGDNLNNPQGGGPANANLNGQPDLAAQAAMMREMQLELQQLRQQQGQMQVRGDNRTIGDTDTPHTYYQDRAAICPPPINRNDFEIKPQMIALVKQHMFHGLPAEHPMDHIDNFEAICNTTKAQGVPPDWLRCKLFPFSLADKANRWLKSLPPATYTTWPAARDGFLDHFYTKTKTASLRNKIITFTQLSGESFAEAWERFKEYRRDCPHHGYSDEQILSIFYEGVDWEYKNSLNAASNGNFMTQNVAGAYQLIDNLAASSSHRSIEYDRSRKATVQSVDAQKIDELNAKINLLLKANQRPVHSVEEEQETTQFQQGNDEVCDNQEVNFVGNGGYGQNNGYTNFRNHPNLSYRSNNVENPQDQVYPNQQKQFNAGFQGQPQNQNQNYQKNFYPQNANPVQAQPNAQGFVKTNQVNFQPKQFMPNFVPIVPVVQPPPQDELKMMMQQLLVSQQKTTTEIGSMYADLNGKIDAINTHLKVLDTQVAQTADAVKRQQGALPSRGEQNPRAGGSQVQVSFLEEPESSEESNTEAMLMEILEGQRKSAALINERLGLLEWKVESMSLETQRQAAPPASIPPTKKVQKTKKIIKQAPSNSTGQKTNTDSTEYKLLPKLEDPGRFVVPCSILGTTFNDSMCDSGSTVNVISWRMARSLGILDKMVPSEMTLRFADASVKQSRGVLKDLQVKIDNCLMAVDFQVVEMRHSSYMPLILGRPFLATAGAVVDLPNKRVCLSKVNTAVFYNAISVDTVIPHGTYATFTDCFLTKPKKGSPLIYSPKRVYGNYIEYRLKNTGIPRRYGKVRALITPELKDKGLADIQEMMNTDLSFNA